MTNDSTHRETQLDLRDQVRQALQVIRTEARNLASYRLNDEARSDAAAAIDRIIDRIDALLSPSPETEEAKARLELIALMDDAVNRAKGCDCARWPNCVCNNAYVRFKDSFAELLAASHSQEDR